MPFVLLEAADRTGGLVRTDHVDGFTIDAGADSMLAAKPAAIRLCEELGLGPRLMSTTPPRTAFVHAHGELHPLPSPSVFGIPTTRCWHRGVQPAAARCTRPSRAGDGCEHDGVEPERPDDESVADFYRRQFGPATVGLIAEPLLGGIHAGDVEQLSMAAVAPRLVAAARSGRLFDAPSPTATAGEGLFKALRGGMGELVAAIEGRLPAGSVRVRSGALRISRERDEWQVAHARRNARRARPSSSRRRRTPPARLLAGTDAMLAGALRRGPVRVDGERRARLAACERRPSTAGSGFVVARQHSPLRITACTWVSSKWEDRARPGMVLLRAFLGGASDPAAVELTDEALVEIATSEVSAVLGDPAHRTSRACSAGRARAPSTTSDMPPAWRASTSVSPRCPDCSSPAAASTRSAFRTASPTAGPLPLARQLTM